MNNNFREVGIGSETGTYSQGGTDFAAEALTIKYATTGSANFLTGVAYTDINKDAFYSMGEGLAGVTFNGLGLTTATATAEAGGYALALGNAAATAVTGRVGTLDFAVTVDMSVGNVKLDVVGGTTFATSGNITLGAGINNAVLLGVNNLTVTGNTVGNVLTGNSGRNTMNGLLGNDKLFGQGGNDALTGAFGNDQITGGKGADVMTGGTGADVFIFGANDGVDRITDFSLAGGDRLRLDDALWGGVQLKAAGVISQFASREPGGVLLDFGLGEQIHLVGLTGVAGLGAAIDIY